MSAATDGLFAIDSDIKTGNRRFVRVVPKNPQALADALASRVRDAYFDLHAAETRLREGINELARFDGTGLVVTESEIATALEDELDAVLPAEWKGGRPRQTDPQRSELAEIIAADVARTLFDTIVPASRIAHKEVADQQARGVDVLGLEEVAFPNVTLIVAEVKGSCQGKSPPGVVSDMADKLTSVSRDRRQIIQELIWLRRYCDDEYASICSALCSGFLLRKIHPSIILTPILIRTSGTEGLADHGVFEQQSQKFSFPIRFIGVIIDVGDLFDLARAVYEQARRLAQR